MLGHLMLDVEGHLLTEEDRELIMHPHVGGVILFKRNYHSLEQLAELVQSLRSLPNKNLLIAVDHEGGRVQRFQEGFTKIPPMNALGHCYDEDPPRAQQWAENIGWLAAAELRAFDIDLSFSPVLDLGKGVSEVIGNRAFHKDPKVVASLASHFCKGMRMAGMAPVGKHFPGHGSVAADSHTHIPVDARSLQALRSEDIFPFQHMASDLAGIMPALVVYSQVDDKPACLSKRWLKDILREELKFEGAIISDDLSMTGASGVGDYAERTHQALAAGCDMIIVCNNRQGVMQVMKALPAQAAPSRDRLKKLRGGLNYYSWQELQRLPEYKKTQRTIQTLNDSIFKVM